MKRPTMLIKALLQQAALDLDLSVERDVKTLIHRYKHEGLSFLTITLPMLSDSLERGIEDGLFSCPTNFSRHGSLPCLFKGFFNRVFYTDGRLLEEPCPESIYWIRQISRFFKKLKIECSPRCNAQAIENFLQVEGELRQRTSEIERNDYVLDFIARLIWAEVLPEPESDSLVCRHGPGVTADRYLSNERNRIRNWDDRAEQSYPSDLHCYPNFGYAAEESNAERGSNASMGIRYRSIPEELGVRVVFVPKTQLAPRVIAIEPAHKQYMQQALLGYIIPRLEKHKLTRESLRFSDQRPNQRLAYSSSINRRLATLDLKDASDRVHLHLVQRIFQDSGILEYLEDARSLHATLPNEKNIVLWKYASMGSALCFPVEAMVFYTLIQSAMHQLDGIRPTFRSIAKYSRKIDIYGDDIIVPIKYTDVVVRYLESYSLKVNVNKSYRNSLFRESCGADYFNGYWVKPIYARQLAPDNARDWSPTHVMAWVSTADQFYKTGKWHIAQAIRDMVINVMGRPIPRCRSNGAGVYFFSYLFTTGLRYNSKLHCWEQRRTVYTPLKRKDIIDGDPIACLNAALRGPWLEDVSENEISSEDRIHLLSRWPTPELHSSVRLHSHGLHGYNEGSFGAQSECLEGAREASDGVFLRRHNVDVKHETAVLFGSYTSTSEKAPRAITKQKLSAVARDFMSSTYRGRYKSKCRWTSISY